MQRAVGIFVTVLFVFSSIFAGAQQPSSVPAQTGNHETPNPAQDCSSNLDAVREATRILERDRRALAAQTDPNGAPQMNGSAPPPIDLRQDLSILEQKVTDLNQCTLGRNRLSAEREPATGCSNEQLLSFQMNHEGEEEREIPIWHMAA